ncbi:MAG: hypothetical protein IK118_09750, partial [Clostridia bacterium]|nr:hypothetical protein [Clostridia bacterium]
MKNNRIIRGALAVLLCAIMFAGTFVPVFAENLSGYQVGDVIEYGTYPQTRVTNAKLLEKLNDVPKTWKSYGYYSGTYEGSEQEAEPSAVCDGQMTPSDYMKYADFFYGGTKYRAVSFTSYRPAYTFLKSQSGNQSFQKYNGYQIDQTYYFIYEPIRWRVLDSDNALIISEMVLDSQSFNNMIQYSNGKYYCDIAHFSTANDFNLSSIRTFLQDDFFQTAFSPDQQSNIRYGGQYGALRIPQYYIDVAGVLASSEERVAYGTDYAKSQGLESTDGKASWWTQECEMWDTRGDVYRVDVYGNLDSHIVCDTSCGVRPICHLKTLKADAEESVYLSSAGTNGDPSAHTGELMMFGTYPQSRVTGSDLVSKLNGISSSFTFIDWKSYGYYMGDAASGENIYDGKMKPRRFMQFADFFCDGVKYRAVTFSDYRPKETGLTTVNDADPNNPYLLNNTWQDDNGYDPGEIYYFRYEPILWRILDPTEGLIMSETILDSQSYMTTLYKKQNDPFTHDDGYYTWNQSQVKVDWYNPTIRDWLNYDFYYTAFSDGQQEKILENVRERQSSLDGKQKIIKDNVFLLSTEDVTNGNYGFFDDFYDNEEWILSITGPDVTKMADTASEYAKCQGLKDNSWLILENTLRSQLLIDVNGCLGLRAFTDTSTGIRCAMKLSGLRWNTEVSEDLFSARDSSADGRIVDPAADGVILISALANRSDAEGVDSATDAIYTRLNHYTVSPDDGGFDGYDYNLPYDSAVRGTVSVSSEGYHDYMIPKEVSEALRESLFGCDGVLFARMEPDKGDGKPYVSTVFARKTDANSAYKEISKGFFTFGENEQFDIIVSAGRTTGAVTYWLYQDDAHKLSSSTGRFDAVKLSETFSSDKDLYAYVTCGGVNSDAVKILLEQAAVSENPDIEKMVQDGDFKATGALTGIDFSDPAFLKYAKFDLSAFKIPVDFSFHDNRMRFSLGLSLWNATKPTTWSYGSGDEGGSAKDKKDWAYSNFKKDFQKFYSESSNGGVAKNFGDSVALKEKYDKSAFSSLSTAKNMFDVSALGYVEFEYRNDHWVCCEGSLSICLSYSFSITQQGWIGPVPEYSYLQFKVEFSVGATMSFPLGGELTFDGFVSLSPTLTVGGGVGFKDLLSFGIWGSVAMPIKFTFREKHLTMGLTGSFGIEVGFLYIFKYKQTLFSGTKTLVDKKWGGNNRSARPAPTAGNAPPDGELDSGDIPLTLADRDYASHTSGWLGGSDGSGNSPMRRSNALTRILPSAGMNTTTLQTNVFEGSTPQIAAVGDTMVMTFVQD